MDHGGYLRDAWRKESLVAAATLLALIVSTAVAQDAPGPAPAKGQENPAPQPAVADPKADGEKPAPQPQKQVPPAPLRPLPGQIQMRGQVLRRGLPNPAAADASDDPVFFPADRATLQRLAKAQELLEENRFGESVRLLGDILDGPEDYFFQPKRDEPVHRSLRSEAQRLIGELPPEGRASYELQFGAIARQKLDAAAAHGDVAALAAISRRFFHTEAGYEATYVLAEYQLDRGQPLSAALSFQRLRDTPAAARLEPTLSLKTAACWELAGMNEKALPVLKQLAERHHGERVSIAGREVPLFRRDEEALNWLAQTAGIRPAAAADTADQWPMYRGSASRNTTSNGSSPLLSRRWALPTSDPFGKPIEDQIKQLRDAAQDQGNPVLCTLHPLAVGDLVFMRTVGGLLAVNFATGKRVWPGPVDDSIRQLLEPAAPASAGNLSGRVANNRMIGNQNTGRAALWLAHRLWEDTTYGTMSSDGARIFCVEDLDVGLGAGEQRQIVNFNGRRVPQQAGARAFNRLAAYDISTEGKLKWEAGGQPGEVPSELAGAYFLGPPLPLADRVYALTEVKGEIRVVALDAATGKLDWSQQLAVLDPGSHFEPLRRGSGASPSYADGVLVCPTSAGAVVALDLTTRSLLWGYQYTRNEAGAPEVGRLAILRNQAPALGGPITGNRWTDGTVTIAVGRVLLTPPESNQIHCLNLADGKRLWQKPREDGLYVGCVAGDKVLVVGRNSVRALTLNEGDAAWSEPVVALPVGGMPSGRGFFNGQRYHLPLTTAEVAAIDVASGRIVARSKSRSGTIPGNLICHRGAVISQNVDVIERFDQRDDLWQQITTAIAANADDAAALARRGELLLDEGNFRDAAESLDRSFKLSPDARTRELLVDALLEGLRVDFARNRGQLAEIEGLIDQPAQRSTFLRLVASGWQAEGNVSAAFAAYMRIAGLEGGNDELARVEHTLSVRRDRWVQARVKELLDAATPAERAEMEQSIAARLEQALQVAGSAPLRKFLAFYDALPIGAQAREQLAVRLIEEGNFAEAEQLLRRLEQSADHRVAATATARYYALLVAAKRFEDAAIYYRQLAGPLADVECLPGKTGAQLAAELPGNAKVNALLSTSTAWPVGAVERQETKSQSGIISRHFTMDLSGPLGPFHDFASFCIDQQQQSILGLDGFGREQWRLPLRDIGQNAVNMFFGNGQMNPSRVSGHIVVISMGYQILAVDTLGNPAGEGARVLWRHDLLDRAATTAFQPQPQVVQLPWAVPRVVMADQLGRPLGSIGPVSAALVCYQRMRNVLAVNPVTGETQWMRGDLEPGSDLFGDDELLFIVPPNSEDALVVRALDGKEMGHCKVPASAFRMTTLGRHVLSWQVEEGKANLRLTDPWADKTIWMQQFDHNAKPWLVADEAVGVMTHDGRFSLRALNDGHPIIEEQVTPEPNLSEIYVLRGPDQYILAANRPMQARNGINVINRMPATSGIGNPLISGHVHVFDRHTGQKIGTKAVDRQGLQLAQPAALPVLSFVTLIYDQRNRNRAQNGEAEVFFLDKRNARVVHEEKMAQPLQQGFDIVGDPDRHQLVIKAQGSSTRLTFTGAPMPETAADGESDSDAKRAGQAVLRGLQNWFQGFAPVPVIPGDK